MDKVFEEPTQIVYYLYKITVTQTHVHTNTHRCPQNQCISGALQCEHRFPLGALKYLLTQKNLTHQVRSHHIGYSIHELLCVWQCVFVCAGE